MINSPEANVELTDEDQAKLVLVESRLKIVQGEVLAATKELASVQAQIATTTEAKAYEEQQLATLKEQVAAFKLERESLVTGIASSKSELENHRIERHDMNKTHTIKQAELDVRESNLFLAEGEYVNRSTKLALKEKSLDTEREQVEHARLAFLDAIETVTWK